MKTITISITPEYIKKAKMVEANLEIANRSALFRYLIDKEMRKIIVGDSSRPPKIPQNNP